MRSGSSATLLIRGGTLVTSEGMLKADLLATGERIKAIGHGFAMVADTRVLEAEGCYVMPGVIDAHTHIALNTGVYQTSDDWLVGTRSAACGGVTTVVDFATQSPGQALKEAVERRIEEARDAAIDYALHVMVTDVPPGKESELADLADLGTPSVKLYTTYRPNYYADDATVLRLLETCADLGLRPLVHCENDALVTAQTRALIAAGQFTWQHHGRSRPAIAEQEAVHRILFLAEAAGCPVHIVHCSTARSVSLVDGARERGQPVTCETCPQYLLLDSSMYGGAEPWRYVLQPPLREAGDPELLWKMVEAGRIDLVTTDHCDYNVAQKTAQDDLAQTPGGLPGLETLLPLMYTYGVSEGRMTLPRLASLLSTGPARVWGLWPRKGALQPGADADIVVYDPEPADTVRTPTCTTRPAIPLFEGLRVQGRVRATVARGRVVYREGRFTGRTGRGEFVARPVVIQQPRSGWFSSQRLQAL